MAVLNVDYQAESLWNDIAVGRKDSSNRRRILAGPGIRREEPPEVLPSQPVGNPVDNRSTLEDIDLGVQILGRIDLRIHHLLHLKHHRLFPKYLNGSAGLVEWCLGVGVDDYRDKDDKKRDQDVPAPLPEYQQVILQRLLRAALSLRAAIPIAVAGVSAVAVRRVSVAAAVVAVAVTRLTPLMGKFHG